MILRHFRSVGTKHCDIICIIRDVCSCFDICSNKDFIFTLSCLITTARLIKKLLYGMFEYNLLR